jgi:hypothetical protein
MNASLLELNCLYSDEWLANGNVFWWQDRDFKKWVRIFDSPIWIRAPEGWAIFNSGFIAVLQQVRIRVAEKKNHFHARLVHHNLALLTADLSRSDF